jgi:hypothetical protein
MCNAVRNDRNVKCPVKHWSSSTHLQFVVREGAKIRLELVPQTIRVCPEPLNHADIPATDVSRLLSGEKESYLAVCAMPGTA